MDGSNNVQDYQTDGLDSVRATTDGAGNVVQGYQTDEFGNHPQTLSGVSQPFQYAGQLRDTETGFDDLRARMYDPNTGRFASRDPLAGSLGNPSSLNRYAYAGNNPVTGLDPSGMCPPQEGEPARSPQCGPTFYGASGGAAAGAAASGGGPSIDIGGAVAQGVAAAEEWVQLRLPLDELEGNPVPYGSGDLSQQAIKFRLEQGGYTERNVAVVEYNAGGELRTEVAFSVPRGPHAEEVLRDRLSDLGVEGSQVTRIYSELQPCNLRGHNCWGWIPTTFPNAEVSWSFEYGGPLSRALGRFGWFRALRQLYRNP